MIAGLDLEELRCPGSLSGGLPPKFYGSRDSLLRLGAPDLRQLPEAPVPKYHISGPSRAGEDRESL